jgi:predicted nucleotidyltransferase
MTVEELKRSGQIIMECIAGSHLYGTNIPESDIDIRGIFAVSNKNWLGLIKPSQEISENNEDVKYFELRKFFELALTCNPNIIELLFVPKDCLKITSNMYKLIVANRDLFITKKAFYSFTGYAVAQIKKARGKNKRVHGKQKYSDDKAIEKLRKLLLDGQISAEWVETRYCQSFLKFLLKNEDAPVTEKTDWKEMDACFEDEDISKIHPPRRRDFCYVIPRDYKKYSQFPGRNVPLVETDFDLSKYNCSAVEHIGHLYRMYYYGDTAKGIYRDSQIVCESIPIEDEDVKFVGLLTFNSNEYEQTKKDWRDYWEWMANRNDARWIDQESGETDFDKKNMCHVVRLLLSGENILKNGEPIVRCQGEMQKFLLDIRNNKYEYEYLLKFAEDKMKELEALYETSTVQHSANTKKIYALYDEIVEMNSKRHI